MSKILRISIDCATDASIKQVFAFVLNDNEALVVTPVLEDNRLDSLVIDRSVKEK